jgi:hypothetical protein
MSRNVLSIGISANTPLSLAIIDENGIEQPDQTLSSGQLFLCFEFTVTKQALDQLGLPTPSKLIDLKVELCLLDNVIEKSMATLCFHQPLHEMVLTHKIDTVAPDGGLWLHPIQQVNQHEASQVLALRHAHWLLKFWQKHQPKINVKQALERAAYYRNIYEISAVGFPVDFVQLQQAIPTEAVISANEILKVTSNGRCYSPVKPYATKTGRNSTSSNQYPLSIKANLRNWFKPVNNRCFVHLDFHRQEIGIAAALSHDKKLKDLYLNGDPYLWFANQCDPSIELKKAKRAFIAFQYGATPSISFSKKISLPQTIVKQLHNIHHATFTEYWLWTDLVIEDALADGFIALSDGWQVKVTNKSPLLSVINWPIQGTGAQLLRNVVCELGQQGIYPIGLNHDALLFECACVDASKLASKAKAVMQSASLQLLGFELAISVDIGQSNQSLLHMLEK